MKPFSWLFGSKSREKSSYVYGLDHAILNISIPPQSMWMNLGYWKDESDLPSACAALLDQVLITANLLPHPPHNVRLHLLDVGIGCGDQSLHLLNLPCPNSNLSTKNVTGNEKSFFHSYTGLTILPAQADFARHRLQTHNHDQNPNVNIFCADAANPSTWSPELHISLSPSTNELDTESVVRNDEHWLLALDTLYHFHPSRAPLLHYASSALHASFMAFDLLRADNVSLRDRLLLRLVCWVSGTPYANLLTREEYEAFLVRMGYALADIQIKDISEHVFSGIAVFLRRREEALRPLGMGLGKFRGAGWVFAWWARTGIIRGVIVVARHGKHSNRS